jgi:hypothetical protein
MSKKLSWILVIMIFIGISLTQSALSAAVSIWLMNENSGKVIKDATGAHKQDGTLIGGVKWEPNGKFGSAVSFDGSSGHIEIPDPDNRLTPKNITLMAWVKLDEISGLRSILEQYDWAGAFGTHAFRMDGAQVQLWVIWGAAGENVEGGAVKAGEWTHVAGSYDGENVRTYINGKMAAEKKLAKKDLVASSKTLSIGVRGDSKDVQWLKGLVDEVAIFNTALSEKELTAIVNSKTGLSSLYLAVSPKSKLTVTWAEVKQMGL